MKKIGIIGGIGPEATVEYYRLIIKYYREKTADGRYPEIVINSINMTHMINLIEKDRKSDLVDYLSSAVKSTAAAGADMVLIASNTPHLVFDQVEERSPVPMVSIVRESCREAGRLGIRKAGLLGTMFTMNNRFYHGVFNADGIDIVTPDDESKLLIHGRIFSELVHGIINDDTRSAFTGIIRKMKSDHDIDGLILGCTELPLILSEGDVTGIRFLNTTELHAKAVVDRILQ